MADSVLQLCVLSILCGAFLCIMPDGGSKTICQILCTAVLIISILSPVIELDFESYAIESAKLWQLESEFSDKARQAEDSLNRRVIQQQYREYILDKAEEAGVGELDVQVHTQWSTAELWIPYSCEICGSWDAEQMEELKTVIIDELGIPEERQSWTRG